MARQTVLDLLKKKADHQKIVAVTAYDYTMARLVDAAGVDVVLVGDSLGMVVQGHEDTLPVTLDHMVYHTASVARAVQKAHLVADLPFLSWQTSPGDALRHAGRLLAEGRAQSVKLEGGRSAVSTVKDLVEHGIPVMGHLGLTPQSVHALGGFRVQGRSHSAAERLVEEAVQLEEAGIYALVLEAIPAEVAQEISARLTVPTIGIGAGVHCDGQVLVVNDLLGLNLTFNPRFCKRYASLETEVLRAVGTYAEEVRGSVFPSEEHSFHRQGGPRRLARLY